MRISGRASLEGRSTRNKKHMSGLKWQARQKLGIYLERILIKRSILQTKSTILNLNKYIEWALSNWKEKSTRKIKQHKRRNMKLIDVLCDKICVQSVYTLMMSNHMKHTFIQRQAKQCYSSLSRSHIIYTYMQGNKYQVKGEAWLDIQWILGEVKLKGFKHTCSPTASSDNITFAPWIDEDWYDSDSTWSSPKQQPEWLKQQE